MDADPIKVSFYWSFNQSSFNPSSSNFISPNNYYTEGMLSILKYTPKGLLDYGIIYCWAVNSAGIGEPCKYTITLAGPPESPNNCTIANVTMDSLMVSCTPGYDGGIRATYFLEVYQDDGSDSLKVNQSNKDSPFFLLKSLASGNSYVLKVYATNDKGKSSVYTFKASTQLQAQWTTGKLMNNS